MLVKLIKLNQFTSYSEHNLFRNFLLQLRLHLSYHLVSLPFYLIFYREDFGPFLTKHDSCLNGLANSYFISE